jgi:putative SbcD/Mre11-related phosphoesterase
LIKIIPNEAVLILQDKESVIVVSDLHLGIEKDMAAKGFRLPSYTVKMVERIRNIREITSAKRIIILGDVKHSIGKVEDIDWQTVPSFFETMLDLFSDVIVLPGNHDGNIAKLLPPKVRLFPAEGLVIKIGNSRFGLAHGHAWPTREAIESGNMIIGHSHFSFEIRDRFGARSRELVWVSAEYDINGLANDAGYRTDVRGKGRLIVMPPFNRIVGGQPINSERSTEFGPVLSSRHVDVLNAEIFLLDGTRISFEKISN